MPALRSLLHAALAVAGSVLLAACDSGEESLAKHYERGVELAAEGEPEKAILEFRNALKIDEAHTPSIFGIAEALEAKGDLRGTVGHLLRVIEVEPDHVPARVKLAQTMAAGGTLAEAQSQVEAAEALAPENPDVLVARATLELRLGNRAEALAAAETALALAPDHAGAGMILIGDRLAAGDTWEAMALVERFLEGNPENLPLNLTKLQLLEADPMQQAAVGRHLEHLVALYPEEPQFRLALAGFRRQSGDDEGAIEAMRGLAALDPADSETVLQLVQFLNELQGEQAAREELESRIAEVGEAAAAFPYHQALAALDLAAGRADDARARFDRLIAETGLAEARLGRARLGLTEGDMAGALALIGEVLDEDPSNIDALALRAAVELAQEDPDTAVLTIRSALNEAPGRSDLLRLAALAYERTGNLQLAGESLAQAMRVTDYAPEPTLAYVRFLRQRDRPEAAGTVLEEALRRHGQDPQLLATAAEIRLELGNASGAEELGARLAGLGEEESRVMAKRIAAAALGAQGRSDRMIETLEPLARDPEKNAAAFAQLLQSYVQAGRTDDAVAFVERVLEENPASTAALLARGMLHEQLGETEAAVTQYRAAVAAAPEVPAPYMALMRFHLAQDDLDQAQEIVETGIAAVPASAGHDLRLARGGLQERQGDFDGAIETYQALFDERPNSLVVANNLASLLADHRADDPASLERAVRVARRLADSPVPQFQDTYGWTLHLQGDHNLALRSLLMAVEGLPDNPWVQFHIGRTYAALDQPAEAQRHLERARELGGGSFPPRAEIEQALEAIEKAKPN